MSCPQHSVGAGVGFDTGKGRDSGAAGQICNTSKTYKKADKNTCFRDWADLLHGQNILKN